MADSNDGFKLTPAMLQSFLDSDRAVRTHIHFSGCTGTRLIALRNELYAVEEARTVRELVLACNAAREAWSDEVFEAVTFNLEPAAVDGSGRVSSPSDEDSPVDVIVDFEVTEFQNSTYFRLSQTAERATPNILFGFNHLRGGAFSLIGSVNSDPLAPAVQLVLGSRAPRVGKRGWYTLTCKTDRHDEASGMLDKAEQSQEVKAGMDASLFGLVDLKWSTGMIRRRAHVADAVHNAMSAGAPSPIEELEAIDRKAFVRLETSLGGSHYHTDPKLFSAYPMPIAGLEIQTKSEVAGMKLGGDSTFAKSEVFVDAALPLHPRAILNLNLRGGAVAPIGSSAIPIPYHDRMFLNWRHIRGMNGHVGPTQSYGDQSFAIGGNAVWAASASLNLPLLPFPNNGLASMHLFANAGNLCQFDSMQDVQKRWRDMFSQLRASIGAGLVITRVPLLGPLPNGRLELNFSLPVNMDGGKPSVSMPTATNWRQHVRFGLVWSTSHTR